MGKCYRFAVGFFTVFLCAVLFCSNSFCQQHVQHRNYLSDALTASGFRFTGRQLVNWQAQEKEHYTNKIHQLPDSIKAVFIGKADKALLFGWPALPASGFLEFKQNGERVRFEQKLNERREYLNNLAIGALISGDEKYLPQLVNGLWATLEESTWEIPAIVAIQKAGPDLPDPEEQVIGLVSAETGVMLAVIRHMLNDQLQAYSPMINKRIVFELRKRILEPYLQRDDYWWMGFSGKPVNNWNAWINTNVLHIALLTETDPETGMAFMRKLFRSADYFVNQYPEDGGCDEGPSYWNIAGGKLIRLLQLATSVSEGRLTWSSNQLLHRIGSYIYKMHIAGDYFVNFADATPQTIPSPESIYRFGAMFGDDLLKQFAAYLFALNQKTLPANSVVEFLSSADVYKPLSAIAPRAVLPAVSYLPDLQVMTARSDSGSTSGLFLAVQGGHNGESHNHNDVGNFIIYANGLPVIIDAGVGTYTAQTFSDRRYELWNMQSQWHNCPVINGVAQQNGPAFGATAFHLQEGREGVQLRLDMAAAYPPSATVTGWERTFQFDQYKQKIRLSDKYQLEKRNGELKMNFLSICKIVQHKAGEIGFYHTDGRQLLLLKYAPGKMFARVEEKLMGDDKLIRSWGKKLYQLSLTVIDQKELKGAQVFEFFTPLKERGL
ncbi:MAG: heparinase II/III family protein [Sphingobacteriia bacterium]|nr:heparinase II/III family protein [Sphingobacteriia bacterium]